MATCGSSADASNGDDRADNDDDGGTEQIQASQHVFHDADVQVERAEMEIPVERVVVRPSHIDEDGDQQRGIRDDLPRDPPR